MSGKSPTWEALIENLETGLYHDQRPLGDNRSTTSWDRKRIGYVETDEEDNSVPSVYRFSIKDVDGEWYVSLDFPDHSLLFSGMNHVPIIDIDTNEMKVGKEEGWEEFINYLEESSDNIERLAENYLKTTNYMNGELLRTQESIEEAYTEARGLKSII